MKGKKNIVVKTAILAGIPSRAGTSKASIPRLKVIKSTLNMAGRTGEVTRLKKQGSGS